MPNIGVAFLLSDEFVTVEQLEKDYDVDIKLLDKIRKDEGLKFRRFYHPPVRRTDIGRPLYHLSSTLLWLDGMKIMEQLINEEVKVTENPKRVSYKKVLDAIAENKRLLDKILERN